MDYTWAMTQTDSLSQREQEVVELLLQGKSNKQIALTLGIADSTVEFHLTNVYAKLQVSSRTEVFLKLGKSTGRTTTDKPGKSRVDEMGESADNDGKPILTRRIPMKNILTIAGAVLLITIVLIATFVVTIMRVPTESAPPSTVGVTQIPATATPTLTPQPTISSKEPILEQIRQAVAEYEQDVQAEKKNGKVEFSKDEKTGEDIFRFQGESYVRIDNLNEKLWEQINQLNALYTQVYRDQINPTPFPTQASAEENKTYYEMLGTKAKDYCTFVPQTGDSTLGISIYSPDEGKYLSPTLGDPNARCEVFGQMLEEFRTAPILAKVNKDADIALIRQITGKLALKLTFQSITSAANAVGRGAALYKDETGTNYYVDVETARLAQIEPNFPSHPDVPASETKSLDELRGIASQFALTNSPRLAELKSVLLYEEGGKGDMHFFTWSYRSKDWSGTEWAMMPPFIQVGVLANGQIATYINSLDLLK